jgi:phage host-nuclease inhibitor protein Gam
MDETPRASDLQLQVEQVNVALRQIKQTQESLSGLETRLADMTRECSGILERWARNDERHATAVVELHSRLAEWNDIERRLLSESTSRIHHFERSLQHEWQSLRHSHEEPLRQIDAHTTRITETCLTAVDQALKGFDRAEARLAAMEQDLQREMGTLAREVRDAVAELRQSAPQLAARQPWPLDNVVRLHNELRAEGGGAARGTLALAEAVDVSPDAAAIQLSPAVEPPVPPSPVREVAAPDTTPPPTSSAMSRRVWIGAAVLLGVVAVLALEIHSQLRNGLAEAAARADAAERGAAATQERAASEIAEARRAADSRLAAAQQAARSAQTLALIAAASDLRRFDLAARNGAARAQVLWSRAHGLAVSGSGLPAPPPGQQYVVWLLTAGQAVPIGPIEIDSNGRATAVLDARPDLPRPIIRAMVTLEPSAGSASPTAPAVLVATPPPAVP